MRKFYECLSEARDINADITLDQTIEIAKGMYFAETMAGAVKGISDRLFQDRQGYKGLQSVLHQAHEMCKQITSNEA